MKNYTLLIITLFWAQSIWAQDVNFEASVNKNPVGLEESFVLTFSVNASGRNFRPPRLSDHFRVYSGPNQSSQMSYVNGQMTANLSYSYILVPINVGSFIIEPASIEVNGKNYSTKPIELKVVKAQNQAQKQQQQQNAKGQEAQDKPNESAQLEDNIYLKAELSKSKVFQGEQIALIYKLYTKVDIIGGEVKKAPEFSGFYSVDIEIDQSNNIAREVINGVIYNVHTVKKNILIPQRAGSIEIPVFELDVTIREREQTPVNTWFGPQYRYINRKLSLKSKPAKLQVSALPEPKPASFTGAVGNFTMTAIFDRNSVNLNDAINLKYTLKGSGNINLIEFPSPVFPPELEVYDPKINQKTDNSSGRIQGSKSAEYLIIPRVPGKYTIPKQSFSYFNPQTEKYVEIPLEFPEIEVRGSGNAAADASQARQIQRKDLQQLGSDIRFINPVDTLKQPGSTFIGSIWFLLLLLIPVILGLMLWIILKKYSAMQADTIGLRKRKAGKMAQKQLKLAQELLNENKQKAMYEELHRSIMSYIGNKFAIQQSQQSQDEIKQVLSAQSVHPETLEKLIWIIDQCEMARFAPSASVDAKSLLKEAYDLIEKLENHKA
jgi:hypothetical protein